MSEFIFTSAPEASAMALNELSKAGVSSHLKSWLAPGVGLCVSSESQASCQERLSAFPPVFIRHLCFVQTSRKLEPVVETTQLCAQQLVSELPKLASDRSLAVQVRLFRRDDEETAWPWTRQELERAVSGAVLAEHPGTLLSVSEPQQIVSVVCADGHVYAGVSQVADNLSAWPGGERRFAREALVVSRAEFKLLEAIEVFALDLPRDGQALDLGAAPGGWTRVLRSFGMTVTAVDPAQLSPAVLEDPGVRHEATAAQAYLRQASGVFDVLVNDMKMDPRASVALTVSAVRALRPGGIGVLTLKLPTHTQERVVAASLTALRSVYEVTGARQLFHNRSEVTVALRRPQ
ncbi:MAG: 50S rRNA methyltransferase [Firmicutes bacterium]|nr:50S rRNA methyltransferase [Bacillota bacterium]